MTSEISLIFILEKNNRRTNSLKSKTIKSIFIALIIIFSIPLLLIGYIQTKRDSWETDRNFYGNEITSQQLKVIKNDYEAVQCQTKNFVKVKRNGETECDYYEDNHKIFTITKEEYNWCAKGADVFYAYRPICKLVYQSERGKLTADYTSEKYSITPHKFSDNELKDIKQKIIKESENMIFPTYSVAEAEKHFKNHEKKSHFFKILCDIGIVDKGTLLYKDKNGNNLTTSFFVSSDDYEVDICGKSLVKSSKYDQLFEDSCFYLPSSKLDHPLEQMLLFAAHLNIHYPGNFFLTYILFVVLIFGLCSIFLIKKNSNEDNEIDVLISLMLVISWSFELILGN